MDSFELNKVAGAVLGTLLFAFGSGFVAEMIYAPKPAGNAGYPLPGGAAPEGGGGGEKEEAKKEDSIATRLASADVEKGKGGTKPCQACHSFEKGGPNKIGPDLWEVVDRKKGSHEGFDYSAGMKEKGGEWTYDDLDHFLTKPSEYVKGTKMAFQGIGDPKARADVILYLHSLAESPKPLPEAGKEADKAEEGKAAGGKPAEGEKKAEGGGADPFVAKVASADPAKGKDGTKPCQACHSFEKGGPNKIGPDLWDVVGRKKGSHEGFDYSAGMKSKGGEWTLADLNQFLTKPGDYVKGTKMAFQGIAQDEKRAEVIAYLRTLSESPKPLPGADKKDESGKKAEGETKADDAKKAEEAKPDDKTAEKPAKSEPDQAKPDQAKPDQAKPDQAKPAETKPEEKKSEEAKPAGKAVETPAEGKPEDATKPEDAKAAEKPPEGDKQPEEAKPAEQSGENKPVEQKPAEEKPAAEKPAEDKPADEKPAQP